MKRTLIIVASIVVLIGIAIAVYFLFFASSAPRLTVGSDPFAGTGSTNAPADSGTQASATSGTVVAPNFVRITASPVALGAHASDIIVVPGTPPVTVGATTTPGIPPQTDVSVRYVDRASGNIYEYLAHARTLTRLSNRTLPGIQEASWSASGSTTLVRFLAKSGNEEHIKTYALPVDGNGGFFLEDDLDQALAVGSSTIFSLLSSTNGSIGTVAKSDGSNVRTLFTSLLSLITVHTSNGPYFAATKASSSLDGYAFLINGSSFTRILGPAPGLTILPSPSGKTVLYSYMNGKVVQFGAMDVATRAQTPLPLSTLTEKCVWASDNLTIYCAVPTALPGNLPDDWYQGAVTFTDRIWKIDLTARVATLVVDPSSVAKTTIDAVGLTLDPASDILVFSDKHNGSLWAYDLP